MGIRELAKELGLSIGTVSRALNDRPDVSPETRARVKAAAERLGYVPDRLGRSLRTGRTGMVAGVIPAVAPTQGAELLFPPVFEGVRRRLRQADLDLILLFCGREETPLDSVRRIVGRHIADGIVLTRTLADDPRVRFLAERQVPHVALGRSRGLGPAAWVDLDVEAAVVSAVELLAAVGHRRFALTVRDFEANFVGLAARAFRARLARHGIDRSHTLVLRLGDGASDAALRAIERVAPTAFLVSDAGLAASLYDDLARIGRIVGRDVAAISFLPARASPALRPRLSSFEADLGAVGAELAERLIAQLLGRAGAAAPGPSRPFPMAFSPRESHLLGGAGASRA